MLKRIFTLFFVLSVMLTACLSSCAVKSAADVFYDEYSFSGSCRYQGTVYTGKFYISEGRTYADRKKRIELNTPDELCGMTLEYADGIFSVSSGGRTVILGEGSLIYIFTLFETAGTAELKKNGDEYTATVDGILLSVKMSEGRPFRISYGDEYICMEAYND